MVPIRIKYSKEKCTKRDEKMMAYFSDILGLSEMGVRRYLRNTGTVRRVNQVKCTQLKVTYLKANVWILITRSTSVKDSEANSSVVEATVQDIQTEKNNKFHLKDKSVVF